MVANYGDDDTVGVYGADIAGQLEQMRINTIETLRKELGFASNDAAAQDQAGTQAQSPSNAATGQAPESIFIGENGRGLTNDAARLLAGRQNRINMDDGVVYSAEEHGDPSLPNKWEMVGRRVPEQEDGELASNNGSGHDENTNIWPNDAENPGIIATALQQNNVSPIAMNAIGNVLGGSPVGRISPIDNRELLNAANLTADPDYYSNPIPERSLELFRQSERAYRQATDTGATWMGDHAHENIMDLPADYPLQGLGSAEDSARGNKILLALRDASINVQSRSARPAPVVSAWDDNGPQVPGLGLPFPQPAQNNPLGTSYGNVRDSYGRQHYGEQDIFGGDAPGAYAHAIKAAVIAPPDGTSNTATEELPVKYPKVFKDLVTRGIGSTVFGTASAHDLFNNSFDITNYPEEAFNDTKDLTYHKYGVLTYLGPVDRSKGITKSWVVKNVLEDRYSFPNLGIVPGPANFSGKSDVYAVAPQNAVNSANLDDPKMYTYKMGVIEQAKVPDGVLNITTEDHRVYPGTIRRTAMEVNGQLYIYTSGAGVNRFNNSGDKPIPGSPEATLWRDGQQLAFALGNDKYGPLAFRALDQQAVKYINSVRNGTH